MRPENIITGKAYLTFLRTITNRMIKLAEIVSKQRFNSKSDLYYGNYMQSASSVTACISNNNNLSIKFIPKKFKFTNNIEHKNIMEEFAYLVKQLHSLCWNISDTYYFVNTILYNYATSEYIANKYVVISNYHEQTRVLRNNYQIKNAMDCVKLPETWTERVKYWFYNIRASDDTMIYSFGRYFKYIEFWFQSNKITNGLQRFKFDTVKDVQQDFESEIDFVNMLFNITPSSIKYGLSLELENLNN